MYYHPCPPIFHHFELSGPCSMPSALLPDQQSNVKSTEDRESRLLHASSSFARHILLHIEHHQFRDKTMVYKWCRGRENIDVDIVWRVPPVVPVFLIKMRN